MSKHAKKELAYPWHTLGICSNVPLRGLLRGRLLAAETRELNFTNIGLFANVLGGIDW
jgi:hypothetical protein